jgi:hypothetical protein
MTELESDAAIAKLRAETDRLELENKKLAAEMTRDLMEYVELQGSPPRKPHALSDWFPTFLAGVMGLGFIGALVFVFIAAGREHHRWEVFAKDHECRVVERRKGDVDTTVAPIIGTNGSVSFATAVTSTPDKTAYLCNDGVKYWR